MTGIRVGKRRGWAFAVAPAAAIALGGCAGELQGRDSPVPPVNDAARVSHDARAVKTGVYASSYLTTSIYAFKRGYKQGGNGPICTIYTGEADISDIAADPKGNFIVPEGVSNSIVVYGGPNLCGPELGTMSDPYGQPAGAASLNAATGTIVVADRGGVGSLAICTLKNGCTKELTGTNIVGYGGGVALAKNGDCWLTSVGVRSIGARMTYWPGCTGSGEDVTGFENTSYGSLSIDKQGNLVALDSGGGATGQVWVYSGCNPACTLVGGPFPVEGNPLEGALDASGHTFGAMETTIFGGGTVDIYMYSPTMITYEYSFNSGLASSALPQGFTYSPALAQ
jgi:hypothetical protein